MMEGPLLEDKFWTEPSIVDTDESEGEDDVDKRLESGSGSDSHVPRLMTHSLYTTPPPFHISLLLLARPKHSS